MIIAENDAAARIAGERFGVLDFEWLAGDPAAIAIGIDSDRVLGQRHHATGRALDDCNIENWFALRRKWGLVQRQRKCGLRSRSGVGTRSRSQDHSRLIDPLMDFRDPDI